MVIVQPQLKAFCIKYNMIFYRYYLYILNNKKKMRGSFNPQNCNDVIKANTEPLRKKCKKSIGKKYREVKN